MTALVHRDKITGEFSCVVNGTTLLKARIASGIARAHDMVEAINMGALPEIHSDGRGDKRRFTVTLGEFVVVSGMSAHGGYRVLDELEGALTPPTFEENIREAVEAAPAGDDIEAPSRIPEELPTHIRIGNLEDGGDQP